MGGFASDVLLQGADVRGRKKGVRDVRKVRKGKGRGKEREG